jgi:hypothetical protein
MITKVGYGVHSLLLFLLLILLSGCESDVVTPDSTVYFNSEENGEIEWTIRPNYQLDTDDDGINDANCAVIEDLYQDHYFRIALLNENGIPLTDIRMLVHLQLTENTFSGTPVLKLYADRNDNGVVDEPEEYVSSSMDPAYSTKTGSSDGEIAVIVRANLSCVYAGSVSAFAGKNASGRFTIRIREGGG